MFYPKGIKIVPSTLVKYLNGRVLAFLIMDNGSWSGSGILLHCSSFTLSDVTLLSNMLNIKLGIKTKIRNKYNKHILYIPTESIYIVRDLTLQYMHPKLYFKLGL